MQKTARNIKSCNFVFLLQKLSKIIFDIELIKIYILNLMIILQSYTCFFFCFCFFVNSLFLFLDKEKNGQSVIFTKTKNQICELQTNVKGSNAEEEM